MKSIAVYESGSAEAKVLAAQQQQGQQVDGQAAAVDHLDGLPAGRLALARRGSAKFNHRGEVSFQRLCLRNGLQRM